MSQFGLAQGYLRPTSPFQGAQALGAKAQSRLRGVVCGSMFLLARLVSLGAAAALALLACLAGVALFAIQWIAARLFGTVSRARIHNPTFANTLIAEDSHG